MSIIAQIKEKLDIVEYINRHVPLKKKGRNWEACCPFHSEKTPSFKVSQDKQSWHCFGSCAEGGDLFAFAQKFHNWDTKQAIDELAKLAGITVQRGRRARTNERLYGLLSAAADAFQDALWTSPKAQHARDYLAGRGFQRDILDAFQIGVHPSQYSGAGPIRAMCDYLMGMGYSGSELIATGIAAVGDDGKPRDRLVGRLIIPIHDHRGRVVGFTGRRLDGDKRNKYINTPSTDIFHRDQILFGLHRAKIAGDTAVIVEGNLDVIQAHQAGFTNVIAQMGTALTDAQLEHLTKAQTIVLALDGDAAGQSATQRDIEQCIKLSLDLRIITLPDDLDPDNIIVEDPDRWRALVRDATPVADYLMDREFAALEANASIVQREALVKKLLPILLSTESDIYKRDSLQKLAAHANIPIEQIFALAGPPRAKNRPPTITPAPTPNTSNLEAYCLRAMLHDPIWFMAICDEFEAIQLAPFGAADFIDLRPIVTVFVDAVQAFTSTGQMPVDYLLDNLDEALLSTLDDLGSEPLTEHGFLQMAKRLRLQRLQHEIDQLLETDDTDSIRQRQREKALILMASPNFVMKSV